MRSPSKDEVRRTALALLAHRKPHATVCPSEVARALVAEATDAWRGTMPIVHATVDELVAEGLIAISWKGRALAARTGPYRIGPPAATRPINFA